MNPDFATFESWNKPSPFVFTSPFWQTLTKIPFRKTVWFSNY